MDTVVLDKKARKNAYMKEYLRRYRKTEHGKEVQKAIKKRQTVKNRIIANLAKLAQVCQSYVEHHSED